MFIMVHPTVDSLGFAKINYIISQEMIKKVDLCQTSAWGLK